jgi:two-component system LytT family response regulator
MMKETLPPLRAIVVDDEKLARNKMSRLLRADARVEVIAECETGEAAVECILASNPDLVFLDVQMPGMSGFDVIAAVGAERMPPVIFVTAYDEYALDAFRVHALDYLLKPVDPELVRSCVERAAQFAALRSAHGRTDGLDRLIAQVLEQRARAAAPRYLDRIMIHSRSRMFFAKTVDIDWIEAADNYVRLHIGGQAHLVRGRIATLEERLDPALFVRIHRSTIINLDSVCELKPWSSGEMIVVLRDGAKVKLSRTYRDRLQKRLNNEPV